MMLATLLHSFSPRITYSIVPDFPQSAQMLFPSSFCSSSTARLVGDSSDIMEIATLQIGPNYYTLLDRFDYDEKKTIAKKLKCDYSTTPIHKLLISRRG